MWCTTTSRTWSSSVTRSRVARRGGDRRRGRRGAGPRSRRAPAGPLPLCGGEPAEVDQGQGEQARRGAHGLHRPIRGGGDGGAQRLVPAHQLQQAALQGRDVHGAPQAQAAGDVEEGSLGSSWYMNHRRCWAKERGNVAGPLSGRGRRGMGAQPKAARCLASGAARRLGRALQLDPAAQEGPLLRGRGRRCVRRGRP